MGESPRTNILDHIVYRAETGNLESSIDRFRSLGFNVISGGTHSDGLTHNALIILPDGVYIELIAFLHDVSYYPPGSSQRLKRQNHPWENRNVGWVEYAHLDVSPEPSNIYDIINKRARVVIPEEGGGVYNPPKPGGRIREDGVELKWTVTFPVLDQQGGKIPFFCQDLTSRNLRVPTDPPSNSSHTNHAQGIARVTVLTNEGKEFQKQIEILNATLGSKPKPTSSTDSQAQWSLSRPNDQASTCPIIELNVPQKGSPQDEFVRRTGGGIVEVVFWTELGPVSLESSGSSSTTVSFETNTK